jgi:hypothetical protein
MLPYISLVVDNTLHVVYQNVYYFILYKNIYKLLLLFSNEFTYIDAQHV